MSATSRWWALDLVLVVLLADVAGAAVFLGAPDPVRIPLAVCLVLFLPGYALVAVFFPATNRHATELASIEDEDGGLLNPLPSDYEIDGVERIVLSVTLSVAVVPAVAAAANFTAYGVTMEPILGGVVAVTLALAVLAFLRRLRLPPEARFGVDPSSLASATKPFRPQSPLYRDSSRTGQFNLAATIGLVLVLASAGFALAAPPTGGGFTEFYVVTDDATGSTTTPYPSTYAPGETRTVPVGVANHEGEEVRYTVVVALQDSTEDDSGVSAAGVEELGRREVTVPDGERREVDVDVSPTRSGEDLRLVFMLYRGDAPAEPTPESAYRVLDLSIDVSGSANEVAT